MDQQTAPRVPRMMAAIGLSIESVVARKRKRKRM